MTKKHSVSSIYLRLSLGLSTLIVILAGATLIIINTQQHNQMVEQVSSRISEQLKGAMTNQVDSSIKLINKLHEEATQELKEQLAKQVRQAHRQANKILKNNRDLPLSRQKELILDTLRPVRFNEGRSSIFIADSTGHLLLRSTQSSIDQSDEEPLSIPPKEQLRLISGTIQQVQEQAELYVEGLTPGLMNKSRSQTDPTVFFYKHLEELDWIIGTKASIEKYEEKTKTQLIGILAKTQMNKRLRLFIADEDLNLLALPMGQPKEDKPNLNEVAPENKSLVNKAIELAKTHKHEVINASWFDQQTQSYVPVMLYISLEPNWRWLIGSFVTMSDVEQEIGLNRSQLADKIEDQILEIMIILLIAYLIAVAVGLWVYRKIAWHFNLFIARLQSAAHENHPVSGEMISIQEFDTLAQTMNEQLEKRATLQQQLEQLAQKDPLTNLYNRRRMDELLSLEVARTKRNSRPFCLIICDIDHFKNVNDTFGHEAGDQVICAVAKILHSSLREQDSVARWGGEEFLIALPETQMEEAEKVAHKLRVLCENHTINNEGKSINFTLTFGVDLFDGSKDIKAVIAAADHALYQGKNQGRNVVVCNKH